MNHRKQIASASVLLGLLASPVTLAEDKATKPPASPRQQIFAKYDLDHNGNLDVSESEALRSAYVKNPADPLLKPFDTDSDAKMSDQEIMKIVYPNGVPKAKSKAKPKAIPKGKKK